MKTTTHLLNSTARWAVGFFAAALFARSAAGIGPGTGRPPCRPRPPRCSKLRDVALTYPAEAVVEAVRQATVAAQVRAR